MSEAETDPYAAERASYAPAWVQRRLLDEPAPVRPAEHAPIDAALLFADISGFTPLAERLALRGAAGAEELSRLLNDYFGKLLALVALHGGEPFKFAGDALMALWPAHAGDLALATHRAAACALAVQALLHRWDAGGGAVLSLRVGVAPGRATGVQLSCGERWHFAVGGAPLNDVVASQGRAAAGDAVVSAAAWALLAGRAGGDPAGPGHWRLTQVDAPPEHVARPRRWTAQDLQRLEGYIPGPARARLAAGHGQWLAELRQVTVLFAQIADLDHTAAHAPGLLQAVVTLAHPIEQRFQGYLKEVAIDDKGVVLVFIFGLPPVAHEDDAARGVRAALDLHAALAAAGHGSAIGVTTGRCFCGVVGSEVRREYAVVGDTMNVAARLMEAAAKLAPGPGILCDAATRQAAAGRIEFEPLAPISVKGKAEPLAIHRPLGLRAQPARAAAEIVGRVAERATVAAAVQRCAERAAAGTLLVIGDAGMGKSCLVEELSRLAGESGVAALSGSADAIEAATPYFAWRKPFEALLGLTALVDLQARRDEVQRRLGPALSARAPLLEAVLALGQPDTPETAQMSGQVRANATQELLLALLQQAAQAAPTCIVLEDGHWFDPATWALALEASRRIAPLLLVITTRPLAEPAPAEAAALRGHPGCITLELQALPGEEALALVCRRLRVTALPPEVEQLIRARAAGLPLYAEELASALRDTGVIKVRGGVCRLTPGVDLAALALALPDNVQGAVTARIDRLAPREELAIKVASVIGSAFAVRLLRDVHPVREDVVHLDAALDELRHADLTVLDRPEPELAHAFKHVITREVAYNLMLFAQRRRLHQAVAEWYERVYGVDRPDLLAVLAHHWASAGVIPKAVAYLEKSATRTFSMGLGKAAVDQGLEAARLLGVQLPTRPAEIAPLLGAELAKIQQLLAGRTPLELLEHKLLADESTGQVIGVLLKTMPFAHQSLQGELFALMALRCMSLTLEQGNGPAAPVVYAMHSIIYRALKRDSRTAHQFAEMALELDARNGGWLLGSVSFIYTWFNQHWVHPLARAIAMSIPAAEAAFAAGDVLYGCFNLAAHVVHRATAGRPLDEVIAVAERHLALNAGRVLNAAFHCRHELQFAKALAGRTGAPLSMSDAVHDEARDIASICATDYYNQIGFYFISKLRLHYYYRDLEPALDFAAKAQGLLPAFAGQTGEIELVFFHALALLARSREVPPDERPALVEKARALHLELAGWAELCEANFRHKALLVRAELARSSGHDDEARDSYTAAAASAAAAGYVQHEALAHELHFEALRDSGAAGWREALALSRSAYERWGALAKVADLDGLVS